MQFWQWQAFVAGLLFINSLLGVKWSIIESRHIPDNSVHPAPAALADGTVGRPPWTS